MTYYLCMECGNKESFEGYQNITEYCTERIYMDGEGDIQDWGDRDCNDSEVTDGPNDLECSECGSGNVDYFDTEEERDETRIEVLEDIDETENGPKEPTDWSKII